MFCQKYWSTGGMGYILMQLYNLPESIGTIKYLESTGEWPFDLTLSGPRLMPVILISVLILVMRKITIRLLTRLILITKLSHDYVNINRKHWFTTCATVIPSKRF